MPSIVIPNDVFFENLIDELSTSGSVLLTVKGWSMFPFFRNEKDAVLLRPFNPEEGLRKGDVALFRYRGKYILHRCTGCGFISPDGQIVMLSQSKLKSILGRRAASLPPSPTPVYVFRGDGNPRGSEYAPAEAVYAVVEKKIAPSGKEWSCSSFSWKLCSRLWPSGYLLRRLFVGTFRRIPLFR